MFVTAIRGANLHSQLEELKAAGVELVDREADVSLFDLQMPILSAQVELGAGPIATALAEDSRVIIAGSYDPAAPLIAAAVANFNWDWDNLDRLASVAVCSRHYGTISEWRSRSRGQRGRKSCFSITRKRSPRYRSNYPSVQREELTDP